MSGYFLEELWKSIGVFNGIDYNGIYEASTFGEIRSVDRKIKDKNGVLRKQNGKRIKQYKNKTNGYMTVSLSNNGTPKTIPVHQLVMNAFNPNPNPEIYTDINHIDEDKTNNRLDNLEWTTHKENCNHGTGQARRSKTLLGRFIPVVQLNFDGNIENVYYSTKDIRDADFLQRMISLVTNKKEYIYKNYFWIKLDEYNNLSQTELFKIIKEKTHIMETKHHERNGIRIVQLSENGTFIKEYESIAIAANEIGCTKSAIHNCLSGKTKTCSGYKWAYAKNQPSRKIVQLDLNYNFVKQWDSITEVSQNGYRKNKVCDCINGKSFTHYGFRWMYLKDYEELTIK